MGGLVLQPYKTASWVALRIPSLACLHFVGNLPSSINIHEVNFLNQFKSLLKMYFVGVSLAESFIYGLVLGWSFEFLLWVRILLCILFVFYWKLSEALGKILGKWLNKSKLISKPLPDFSSSSRCRYVPTQISALYFTAYTTTLFSFSMKT